MPWGADNMMPYNIISKIEDDETLATCQQFNAEVCYGAGLQYNTDRCTPQVKADIDGFVMNNDLATYFLGVCQDLKYFAFAVTVIIFNKDGSKVVRLVRKEACNCRFAPADKRGSVPAVLFADWRNQSLPVAVERIPLLNVSSPWVDLQDRLKLHTKDRKFAILTRVPTPDYCYYPIPYYAALFKGRWYDIKRLIAVAKEAKLRNSAPIKYHIEVAAKYWETIFRAEGITDKTKMQERANQEKQRIIDFLTGAENSGKVWFSTFYVSPDGKEQHDVVINKVDNSKEGGDWETDIQEAINMVCFTMRVHSNLVGSVPGKAQSNNSGSDKRELYTIAQALQKPYHDMLFRPHQIIIRHNRWQGAYPECPFVMLTTLDQHTDAKQVNPESHDDRE
ncbi:MAG: hypothetical protein K5660_04265 [Paludibacteraceae bacterium]|nr:hypothetical protein [Paludibacteraceae bacterium]